MAPKKDIPPRPDDGTVSPTQLSLLVDMNNPSRILEEVKTLFLDLFRKGNFTPLAVAFDSVVALFSGKLNGYRACDTPYHNLKHTTDVFLAVARLLHGAHVQGTALTEDDMTAGLLAALMHDTGYIRKNKEANRSGAEFSSVHVQRSVEFMQHYLTNAGFSTKFIGRCKAMILVTDIESPSPLQNSTAETDKKIIRMIGTADLIGQTADRNYLEKLPLLFKEQQIAGNSRHESEIMLMKAAQPFDDFMRQRIANDLDGVDRYLRPHFNKRWDIDLNLYRETIDRTMAYLDVVLQGTGSDYRVQLRRIQGT